MGVRGWPGDMQWRVVRRRRRITTGFAVAIGVAAAAAVAVVVPMVTGSSPGPSSTAGRAGYVGSSWRLTSVAEGANSTMIPAGVGAKMDLLPAGWIVVNDGINVFGGRLTTSADGFEVYDVTSTLVGYYGKDPDRLAVIEALGTLAYGDGYPRNLSSPARDTVLSADRTQLISRRARSASLSSGLVPPPARRSGARPQGCIAESGPDAGRRRGPACSTRSSSTVMVHALALTATSSTGEQNHR